MKKIEEVLRTVVDYLAREDIEYVLVGGIAVIVYGNPRTTVDLDIVVKLDEGEIEEFASHLQKEGFFADPEYMKHAFAERTHFTAEEKETLFRLDMKGIYENKEMVTLKNRKKVEYGSMKMYVATPEDTIANKLYYGSEQDIEDAESIYIRQEGKIDEDYLEERCDALGVKDDLEAMREEIENLSDSD